MRAPQLMPNETRFKSVQSCSLSLSSLVLPLTDFLFRGDAQYGVNWMVLPTLRRYGGYYPAHFWHPHVYGVMHERLRLKIAG
jgi:hypothetical protein